VVDEISGLHGPLPERGENPSFGPVAKHRARGR